MGYIEEIEECDHEYYDPNYMCVKCGYDCENIEIDRTYEEECE